MELFKHLFALSFIAVPLLAGAQIVGQEGREVPSEYSNKELRKMDTSKRKPTTGMDEFTFYVGGGPVWSRSTIEANKYPFGQPVGERANEKPATFASYQIGIRNRISNWLSYDLSAAYTTAGERYSYTSNVNDSTFSYKTTYSYLAFPLQLLATYGKDWRFFLGGGVEPKYLLAYQQKQSFTNAGGSDGSNKIDRLDHANSFQLAVLASAGLQVRLGKFGSVYCMPQYVWNLTPTTDKQSTYVHKLYYFTVQFGLAFHIPQAPVK